MRNSKRDGSRWRGACRQRDTDRGSVAPGWRRCGARRALVAAPAAAPAAPALTASDLAVFMDGFVPYAIHSANIAGATVSVVANGQILFAKGYGYRRREDTQAGRTLDQYPVPAGLGLEALHLDRGDAARAGRQARSRSRRE